MKKQNENEKMVKNIFWLFALAIATMLQACGSVGVSGQPQINASGGVVFEGDFSVAATTEMDSLKVDTYINNTDSKPISCVVRHRVYENEDSSQIPFLEKTSSLITVSGNTSEPHQSLADQLSPKLWSPEHPNLYLLRTEILDDRGRVLDKKDTIIGFRTFKVDGKHFLLNGKPVYLFAFHMTPPGRVPESISSDPDFISTHIDRLKSLNINFVRLGTTSPEWYEACDRNGIMVLAGSYSGGLSEDPDVWQDSYKAFESAVTKVRNHPSVVMWVIGNEWRLNVPEMRKTAEKMYHKALELDDSRPMFNAWSGRYYEGGDIVEQTGSDFLDLHPYNGWYYSSVFSFYNYKTQEDYPVTLSECVGAYTSCEPDNGAFCTKGGVVDKFLANVLRYIGQSYDVPSDSLWYQAYLTRELSEMTRRGRGLDSSFCGAMPFTFGYAYEYLKTPGDITEYVKPVMKELAEAYRRLHISIRIPYVNLYPGDDLLADLFVLNDDIERFDPVLPMSKLRCELLDQGKNVIANSTMSVPQVKYYSTWEAPLRLQVPTEASKGEYTLRVTLLLDGTELVQSEESVFIAPSGWHQVHKTPVGVIGLYDPAGSTQGELEKLGLAVQKIQDFQSLNAYQYLIIGKNGFDQSLVNAQPALQAFIQTGKRVLVLEQETSVAEDLFQKSSWLGTHLVLSRASRGEDFVNIVRPYMKSLMNQMERKDFRVWNRNNASFPQDRSLFNRYYDFDKNDLDKLAVLANAGQHLHKAVLIEIFPYGQAGGSCLLSQFNTVGRHRSDPKAAKYLANLLDYFLESEEHCQATSVGKVINFGDFKSERGVIVAPLKQGLHVDFHRQQYGSFGGHGRNFRGTMKITGTLGYLEELDSEKIEMCPLYLKTDFEVGKYPLEIEAKNNFDQELKYRLHVNDWVSDWKIIAPGKREASSFSMPFVVPAESAFKLSIEAQEGEHRRGDSIGLVFYGIQLSQ